MILHIYYVYIIYISIPLKNLTKTINKYEEAIYFFHRFIEIDLSECLACRYTVDKIDTYRLYNLFYSH